MAMSQQFECRLHHFQQRRVCLHRENQLENVQWLHHTLETIHTASLENGQHTTARIYYSGHLHS